MLGRLPPDGAPARNGPTATAEGGEPTVIANAEGSRTTPAVVDLVRELAGGEEPNKGLNPDEAVAIGTSLQSDFTNLAVKNPLLLDVNPLSLSIESNTTITAIREATTELAKAGSARRWASRSMPTSWTRRTRSDLLPRGEISLTT
ncbi:Hsp70 family protein [Frankia sp. Cas4]|uniref:Hsp70 family protein n=1 Tax=Frankia sp. Cas4 TaxID=3073927 RepID=UPI003A100CA6